MSHYGSERDARRAANVRAAKLAALRPLIAEADRYARAMRYAWFGATEHDGQHAAHVKRTRTHARIRAAKLHQLRRAIAEGYPTPAYVLLRNSIVAMKRQRARVRRAWPPDLHTVPNARKAARLAAVTAVRALIEWVNEPVT